jgi:hypothetical protein
MIPVVLVVILVVVKLSQQVLKVSAALYLKEIRKIKKIVRLENL